jgi:hypothetical protein
MASSGEGVVNELLSFIYALFSMKLFFAVFAILGLPLLGWGQARLTKAPVRPAATKAAETLQARYARLDQFARQLPEAQATSLAKLAAALATQARTDDDKARLIFTWVAHHIAYDVAFLNGDTTHSYAPEQVLQSRVAICGGYADLFTALATRMNLVATTVIGHVHVDASKPRPPALGADGGHAWNVYRAAGIMHIADPCWGAGTVSDDYQQFTYGFNPFWYDTPPEQAIFLHLPADDSWQLLPAPVVSKVFRQWPIVEDDWFRLGVSGASMAQALAPSKGQPKPKPLPTLYAIPHQVRIVQVPRQATLAAGQPVTFRFTTAPGVSLGYESYGFVLPFTASGSYQQFTIKPSGSEFRIVATHQADSTSHHFLLKYKVAWLPLRAGQHRATAADSVVYLRH